MSASENLELLTPGTVWLRRDGSSVKFLFLTNQNLTAATQQKHPPQIIYADKQGNIFNRKVDDFFSTYQFLNVDGELEKKLENLFVFNAEDYSAVEDPADEPQLLPVQPEPELVPHEETLADSLLRELTAANDERALTVAFGISDHESLKTPKLTAADLSEAVAVYSQEPNKTYNLTQHRLLFKLSDKITVANLVEVFHPSSDINTVDWFAIKTALGSDTIVWDSWIGVYPEYSAQGLYASVLVGSTEAPVDSQETPGIEAVSTVPETPPLVQSIEAPVMTPGLPEGVVLHATSGYAQVVGETSALATEVTFTAPVTAPTAAQHFGIPVSDTTHSVTLTTNTDVLTMNGHSNGTVHPQPETVPTLPILHNADGSVMTAEQIVSLVQSMDLSSVGANLGIPAQAHTEAVAAVQVHVPQPITVQIQPQ
jgi:hypothetical protein